MNRAWNRSGLLSRLRNVPSDTRVSLSLVVFVAPQGNLPDLSTALREQIGVRLRTAGIPIEAVVEEHAEKPSEN